MKRRTVTLKYETMWGGHWQRSIHCTETISNGCESCKLPHRKERQAIARLKCGTPRGDRARESRRAPKRRRDLQGGELLVEGGLVALVLRGVVLGGLAPCRAPLLLLPRAVPHRSSRPERERARRGWRRPPPPEANGSGGGRRCR